MGEEKGSDRAYVIWREAAEKYDYFMTGLAAALAGYIAPTLAPARVSWSPGFVEIAAVLVLAFAVFSGYRRISVMVGLVKTGGEKLRLTEEVSVLLGARLAGKPVLDQATGRALTVDAVPQVEAVTREYIEKYQKLEEDKAGSATRWASARDWSLVAGFVLLLAARVWKGYS